MSSIQEVQDVRLLPTAVVEKADRNHALASPLLIPVYAVAGQANYGFGRAAAVKDLEFVIGSQNSAWIPADSYLEFDVKLAVGTTGTISSGNSFFQRTRLRTQAGVVLHDLESSNLWAKVEDTHLSGAENQAVRWPENQCLQTATASCLQVTATAFKVILPLREAIFRQNQAFHLPVTGQLRYSLMMEVDLNALGECAADALYSIDNPILHCAMIPMESSYIEKIRQVAEAGGLLYHHTALLHNATPTVAANNTVNIQYAMKSVDALIAVPRLPAQLLSASSDSFKSQSPLGGLVSIQTQIGSEFFPSSAIDSVEQAYVECEKTFRSYDDLDHSSMITRANWSQSVNTGANQFQSSTFTVGIPIASNGAFTGMSTVNGPLAVRYNVGTASVLQLDTFCAYDFIAVIRSETQAFIDY